MMCSKHNHLQFIFIQLCLLSVNFNVCVGRTVTLVDISSMGKNNTCLMFAQNIMAYGFVDFTVSLGQYIYET
jgi:hypothetical protein